MCYQSILDLQISIVISITSFDFYKLYTVPHRRSIALMDDIDAQKPLQTPIQQRFIAGLSTLSNKPLSIYSQNCLLSKVFKSTAKQSTQEVEFWILKNSNVLSEHLRSPNFNRYKHHVF